MGTRLGELDLGSSNGESIREPIRERASLVGSGCRRRTRRLGAVGLDSCCGARRVASATSKPPASRPPTWNRVLSVCGSDCCGVRRFRGLEGLVGELVMLGRATELGQAIGDRGRGVEMRHDTDGRLAGVQIHGEARLVGIAEPQVLVVQRANRHAPNMIPRIAPCSRTASIAYCEQLG